MYKYLNNYELLYFNSDCVKNLKKINSINFKIKLNENY